MELHTKSQRPLGENSQLKWPSSQNLTPTMFTSLQILTQMEKYIFCLSFDTGDLYFSTYDEGTSGRKCTGKEQTKNSSRAGSCPHIQNNTMKETGVFDFYGLNHVFISLLYEHFLILLLK